MVRTQIQLTEEQAERLKAAAVRRGVSMAELVRQGIEIILQQGSEKSPDELYRKAALAAGRYRSGRNDVASRHDEYLSEGFTR
jgi:predicted DNA-binding protein